MTYKIPYDYKQYINIILKYNLRAIHMLVCQNDNNGRHLKGVNLLTQNKRGKIIIFHLKLGAC